MKLLDSWLQRFGYVKKGVGPLPDDSKFNRTLRSYLASIDSMEVEDPYEKSVWVFAAVNAIAQNISRVPFYIYTEKTRDVKKIVTTGPLYDLFMNPNPYMIADTLFFATVLYMELYGECFWLFEGRDNISQIPKEIWLANPSRFNPVIGDDKKFRGYWEYNVNEYKKIFAPHEILQFKYWNPYDPIRGLSPIEASKSGVEQDFFANKYNKQFFKDGVALSGIIKAPDFLTDEQFNRLKNQFEEKHAGYGNAHKVGVIEGGADFIETRAMSQRDMEFSTLKRVIRGEILAAFKANEVVLGNYENIQCLHPDTEVMTDKGFVSVADIKVGDLVASFNNGKAEFKPVTKTYTYDHNGDMYTQKKAQVNGRTYASRIDFMVTPEHKMFGKERKAKDTGGKHKSDWMFKRISEIEPKTFVSPRNAEWDGKICKSFTIGEKENTTTFEAEQWMKFLGWFISEGFYKGEYEVGISQKKKDGIQKIKDDLKDFPLNLREQKGCFVFSGKHISEYLHKEVGHYCHEKHIPREVLDLHPTLLQPLFDSLMSGDGTKINNTRYTYSTTSKKLAEDIYELSIKLGYAPTLYGGEEGLDRKKGRFKNARPMWIVLIPSKEDSSRMAAIKPEKVHYEGKVYCIEVPPYHNLLTKYNGKVMWCGNSYEGIKNAHESFWKETLLPKIIYLEDFLWAKFFSNIEGGKYWGGFDTSVIEALREDFGKKVELAQTLSEMGYPINAINKRLDLGFEEVPWGNTWWVKMGMVPVESIMNNPTPAAPAPNEEPNEDKPDDTDEDTDEDKPTEPDDEEEPNTDPSKDVILSNRDDALWARFLSRQAPIEQLFSNKIKRFLYEQRKRVLIAVNKNEMVDFDNETKLLSNLFLPLYNVAYQTALDLLKEEVVIEDSNVEEKYNSFVYTRAEKNAAIVINTIKTNLLKSLEEVLEADVSVRAKKVREFYNKTDNRVTTIARTESSAIINGIRFLLMKDSGVGYHKWISKYEKSRHANFNGKVVKIGESFSDKFTIRYPLDEKAPVNEIINCLCYCIPVITLKNSVNLEPLVAENIEKMKQLWGKLKE